MPSRPCEKPGCREYVLMPGRYCISHRDQPTKKAYDATRDPQIVAFYHSAAWLRARKIALASNPWCSRCKIKWADTVHHNIPVKQATAAQRIDQRLLVCLCGGCHSLLEAEIREQDKREHRGR